MIIIDPKYFIDSLFTDYHKQQDDQESQLLRQEAIELIENDKLIKKEFVTEKLIRAKGMRLLGIYLATVEGE